MNISKSDYSDYTCIDFETTTCLINGEKKQREYIVEIGAARVRNWEIVDTFETLVNPKVPISYYTTKITGIKDEDVVFFPDIIKALPSFYNFVSNDILIGHNIISHDLRILKNLCQENNLTVFSNDVIDTLPLSKRIISGLCSYGLGALCQHYNIINNTAHRALSDVYATTEIYKRLISDSEGSISNIEKIKMSVSNVSENNFSTMESKIRRTKEESLSARKELLKNFHEERRNLVKFLAPMISQGEISMENVSQIFSYIDKFGSRQSSIIYHLDCIVKTFDYNSNSLGDLYDQLCDLFYKICEYENIDEETLLNV